MESPTVSQTELSFQAVSYILGDVNRWRILEALISKDGMLNMEVAKFLDLTPSNSLKHLHILRTYGVVEQRFGRVFSIHPKYRVPNEKALDFGPAQIRLDRVAQN